MPSFLFRINPCSGPTYDTGLINDTLTQILCDYIHPGQLITVGALDFTELHDRWTVKYDKRTDFTYKIKAKLSENSIRHLTVHISRTGSRKKISIMKYPSGRV